MTAHDTLARRVAEEIEQQHLVLAEWLGSECNLGALDKLRAAHTVDFSMITTDGELITLPTLLVELAGARNARPGLRIEVRDIELLTEVSEVVAARFVEYHHDGDEVTGRRVSALLRPDERTRNGLLWHLVHETSIAG